MTDRWTDRLSEYLDGELEAAEREELQAHLFTCAACARTLAELRRVVDVARGLPDREPAEDLWPGIAAALHEAPRVTGEGVREDGSVIALEGRRGRAPRAAEEPHRRRRLSFSVPQLVAAALALTVASAGSVWLLRGGGEREPVGPLVETAPAPAAAADGAHLAAADLTGEEVDAVIADLEQRLEAGRERLDPATVRVLEENLRTIDRAVEEARQALAADPGNAYVSGHLAATVRRKLELLRRANEIASAQT